MLDTVGKYKFHRLQTLVGGKVKDVQDKPKHKNAFQIICKEKSFTVFANTPEEKRSWYSSFESAFSGINYEPTTAPARFSKHISYTNLLAASGSQRQLAANGTVSDETESAPVWVPDSDAERCMVCASKFTAFRRRHHCRKCGKVVCAKCSNYSYKLDNLNKTARVCAFCFKELTQSAPNSVSALPTSDSFENLAEFLSHLRDSQVEEGEGRREEKGGGVVSVTVRRVNASEKRVAMVRGKVLVPQTRKSQRRVLYNITNMAVNGGEKGEQNGNVDHNPADCSTDPSLPPLPALPAQRPRLATLASTLNLSSSGNLTPPNGALHNYSPNLPRPPSNTNMTNTPPRGLASLSLDDSMRSDRRSVDSATMDTHNSSFSESEDLSSALPSLDEHNPSPKLQPRQVAVGN